MSMNSIEGKKPLIVLQKGKIEKEKKKTKFSYNIGYSLNYNLTQFHFIGDEF